MKQKRVLAGIRHERERNEYHSLLTAARESTMGKSKGEVQKVTRRVERDEKSQMRAVLDTEKVASKKLIYDGDRRVEEGRYQSSNAASVGSRSKHTKDVIISRDVSHRKHGKTAATAAAKKRPRGEAPLQPGFTTDAPPEAKDSGAEASKKNFLMNKVEKKGRVSRRSTREKGECKITTNHRSYEEKKTVAPLLSREMKTISSPESSFTSQFEDEVFSDTEAGDVFAGCLTQRIGLDFPTPNSKASERRIPTSNVHSETTYKTSLESQNSTRMTSIDKMKSEKGYSIRPAEGTMEPQSRRKMFGSSCQRNMERSRSRKQQGRSPRSLLSGSGTRKSTAGEKSDLLRSPTPQLGSLSSNDHRDGVRGISEPRSSTHSSKTPPDKSKSSPSLEPSPRKEKPSMLSSQCISSPTITNLESQSTRRSMISRLDDVTASLKRPFDVGASESSNKKVKVAVSFTVDPVEQPTGRDKPGRKKKSIAQSREVKHPKSSLQTRHNTTHDVQASGISSGERGLSKSRRRKGTSSAVASGISGAKAVPSRVDDFSFNF